MPEHETSSSMGEIIDDGDDRSSNYDHYSIPASHALVSEGKDHGIECPTCNRKAMVQRLRIGKSMALLLREMSEQYREDSCNVRNLRTQDGTKFADENHLVSKMAHWRLVQQDFRPRRVGSWRVTSLGTRWVAGNVPVPKEMVTYQGETLNQSTDVIYFSEVLSGKGESGIRGYQPAPSSDGMFRPESLASRRAKIYKSPVADDNEDDLFNELVFTSHETLADPQVFQGEGSVADARSWLYDNLQDGVFCPTCDRFAINHEYKLSDSLARLMIEMYKRRKTVGPIRTSVFSINKRIVDRSSQAYMLVRRGLLEPAPRPKGQTGNWYQITPEGKEWVLDKTDTPESLTSYNRYDKELSGESEERVTISKVFSGSKDWTYEGLMSGKLTKPKTGFPEDELLDLDVDGPDALD